MVTEILKEVGSSKNKDDKEFLKNLNAYLKGEKLDSAIKDFWNNRDGNKTSIKEKYPNLFQQLSFYFLLLQDVSGSIEEAAKINKNKADIKNRINVCSKLFNRSLQIFVDSFGLLENGSVISSLFLWRVVYENYIISGYLANGAEEEAKMFNEYEVVQKNKFLGIKISKEEKVKFAKKYGKDFESNNYCWAKNIKGKKTFLKIVRLVKEKKLYKYYLLSACAGYSNSFSLNNGIVYNEKGAGNKSAGFLSDEVTKSLSVFFAVMSEYANIMIENYIEDKKQKETLKKLVTHYGKEIDRKWKKY